MERLLTNGHKMKNTLYTEVNFFRVRNGLKCGGCRQWRIQKVTASKICAITFNFDVISSTKVSQKVEICISVPHRWIFIHTFAWLASFDPLHSRGRTAQTPWRKWMFRCAALGLVRSMELWSEIPMKRFQWFPSLWLEVIFTHRVTTKSNAVWCRYCSDEVATFAPALSPVHGVLNLVGPPLDKRRLIDPGARPTRLPTPCRGKWCRYISGE